MDTTTPEDVRAIANTLDDSEREQLALIQQDLIQQAMREQCGKGLRAAKSSTELRGKLSAIATIIRGGNLALESNIQSIYASSIEGGEIKEKVGCRKGCSFCCHFHVGATIVEVITIADAIKRENETLVTAVRAAAPQIASLNMTDRWKRRIPCPLLKQGICSIYEYRPLTCRAYISLSADLCEEDFRAEPADHSTVPIPIFGSPRVIRSVITEGIVLACDDERVQSCTVELTAALDLIFSDATVVDRWLNGEAVFQPGFTK